MAIVSRGISLTSVYDFTGTIIISGGEIDAINEYISSLAIMVTRPAPPLSAAIPDKTDAPIIP